MAKVVGIGGVFFRSKDPAGLRRWYEEHLGFPENTEDHPSAVFPFGPAVGGNPISYSVWGPFAEDTDYFSPSEKPFMVNFLIDDLKGLIAELKSKGIEVLDQQEDEQFGDFAWIMDPEETKIELWQAPKTVPGG